MSAAVNYEGEETIRLADARSGVNNNGYVLANTDGDEGEEDEEDEEQQLVLSEVEGPFPTQHRANDLSAKAGAILVCLPKLPVAAKPLINTPPQGLHNICVVIPQFMVTGMSSIIFAFLDPDKSVIHHGKVPDVPASIPPINGTVSTAEANDFFARAEGVADGGSGGTIGIIFK